jgi:RNA polymerase sigma-70 factor (ECF subfamily)
MQRDASKAWHLSRDEDAPHPSTDPRITSAARGDPRALAQLYAEHHVSLRNFARRLLGDPQAAEDLVHDVFVGAPRALSRYRKQCSLTTFLRAIAINQARNHLRAAVRRRAALNRLAQETERQGHFGSDELRRRELARQLTLALDRLSLAHRTTFVLCEVEGLSAEEAALTLGVNAATVRTRIFYARQKLCELLGDVP